MGRDVRLTSPRICNALVDGITSTGVNVVDVGEVPTPVLYHAAAVRELGGGIMVTGSHNPIEYNGIKMVRAEAAVYGDEIQTIGSLAVNGPFREGTGSVERVDAYRAYRSEVTPKLHPERGLRIVIDA